MTFSTDQPTLGVTLSLDISKLANLGKEQLLPMISNICTVQYV